MDHPVRPTTADVLLSLSGRVEIRDTHDHPLAGDTIGLILTTETGEYAYTPWTNRHDPRDEWGTADTAHQAAEELLEHAMAEYENGVEWELHNQQQAYGYGRWAS